MMRQLLFTISILGLVFFVTVLPVGTASAQSKPPAVPPVPVESELLKPAMDGLVVLELFTSRACVFCPKANRLLDDLAQMENVIGLACHVNYFGTQKGSLSRPFCNERQTRYKSTLRSGPNYTPQMVINGGFETIGYRLDDVSEKMREASAQKIARIEIIKTDNDNQFDLAFPDIKEDAKEGGYDIWLATIDKPHKINIKRGQQAVYNNVIGAMTKLDISKEYKNKKEIRIAANLKSYHDGFAVFAQNPISGHIIAAGRYLRPYKKPVPFGPFRPSAKQG